MKKNLSSYPLQGVVYLLGFLLVLNYSCKKDAPEKEMLQEEIQAGPPGGGGEGYCRDISENDANYDSVLYPTILGNQLLGQPYSLATMQQAAINLYGSTAGINVNKKYIRFRPSNEEQITQLLNLDLDLYDYPLDYDIIIEGDYYQQPDASDDQIPWFYTVVETNFQPPAGITYQWLGDLHVPDQDLWLEDEALRITGNPTSDTCNGAMYRIPDPCPPDCDGGTGGEPAANNMIPAGNIEVWDSNINDEVPVRRTKIVARRWFKKEAVYTDDLGNFQCTKRFRNRVNILIKFENTHLEARGLRGARFWQMRFPIKVGIGIFAGALNNIHHVFQTDAVANSRRWRNWWAAQLMNAFLEYNGMASQLGTGQLPNDLHIVLTNWIVFGGGGAAPMNYHRENAGNWPSEFIDFFLVTPGGFIEAQIKNYLINSLATASQDMSLAYRVNPGFWRSDRVKQLMFHELSHAAHYNKVGDAWWNNFVFSTVLTLSTHPPDQDPYGNGDDGVASEYISLSESWAEHLGQFMTDMHYGVQSSLQPNQGFWYFNNDITVLFGGQFQVVAQTGLNTHLNLLEDFSPFRMADPFHWIPYGIFYDMTDNRNDFLFGRVDIDDQVLNYTNQQFFNALDNDITSIPLYRQRLLIENGNNQAAQVNFLFQQYGF